MKTTEMFSKKFKFQFPIGVRKEASIGFFARLIAFQFPIGVRKEIIFIESRRTEIVSIPHRGKEDMLMSAMRKGSNLWFQFPIGVRKGWVFTPRPSGL